MPTAGDSPTPTSQTGEVSANAALDDADRALEVLFAVHDGLWACGSVKHGIEHLLGDLARALGHAAGALWLPHGDVLLARVFWSAPGVDRKALEALVRPLRVERGAGLPGRVWVRAEPVMVGSEADDGMAGRPAALGELRACLGLPALVGAEVLGVIELYSQAPPVPGARLMRALGAVAHELGRCFDRRRGELGLSPLTAREVEVLTLAACGLPVAGIGEQLAISRGTVKSHLEHIYSKLEVVNRTAAVARALRTGLIE